MKPLRPDRWRAVAPHWLVVMLLLVLAGCGGSSGPSTQASHLVSTTTNDGGSISPTSVSVVDGSSTSFTATPADGFRLTGISGCDGSLDGFSYTTGPVSGPCTVTAVFAVLTPPDAPTSLDAAAGDTQVTLTWGAMIEANSYAVYWGETAGIDPSNAASYDGSNTSAISPQAVTGLTNGATYYFVVTASNADGEGPASNEVSATPMVPPPDAPTGLDATAGRAEVELSWNAVIDATSYTVYWSSSPDIHPHTAASYDDSTPAATSPHTVTGLTIGTEYYFIVTASNDGGEGLASAEVSATPITPIAVLNDTGIDWCANDDTNNLACPVATHPGQDAEFGRDAAAAASTLVKLGGGAAGFDFTRVCNSGEVAGMGTCPASPVLGTGADDWACTRDNKTGLIWEVKVNDASHPRYQHHLYSWYNTDAASNGGDAGTVGTPHDCSESLGGSECNTQNYPAYINANGGICGATDWRVPTQMELLQIVHAGRNTPMIDIDYFPNTQSREYWSASPFASHNSSAWYIHFENGLHHWASKSDPSPVRLVRTGP